jgi:GNAT superfamily N-acetyltransferase
VRSLDRILDEAKLNLERDTVYTRFFGYKADVSDAELGRITGADFERAVALLVTIGAGEDEVVIGGASYFVSGSVAATGRSAELAFTVEEDYQSRGIGSLLMRHIIAIARVKGLDRLGGRRAFPQSSHAERLPALRPSHGGAA